MLFRRLKPTCERLGHDWSTLVIPVADVDGMRMDHVGACNRCGASYQTGGGI